MLIYSRGFSRRMPHENAHIFYTCAMVHQDRGERVTKHVRMSQRLGDDAKQCHLANAPDLKGCTGFAIDGANKL